MQQLAEVASCVVELALGTSSSSFTEQTRLHEQCDGERANGKMVDGKLKSISCTTDWLG